MNTNNDRNEQEPDGNEVVKLDFGKYWPSCTNKRLSIDTLIYVQRWVSLKRLPPEVHEKVRRVIHFRRDQTVDCDRAAREIPEAGST